MSSTRVSRRSASSWTRLLGNPGARKVWETGSGGQVNKYTEDEEVEPYREGEEESLHELVELHGMEAVA